MIAVGSVSILAMITIIPLVITVAPFVSITYGFVSVFSILGGA